MEKHESVWHVIEPENAEALCAVCDFLLEHEEFANDHSYFKLLVAWEKAHGRIVCDAVEPILPD